MRNLCCKCPHYYSEHDYDGDYDWGCRVFGSECHSCPSFWDDEGEADYSEMGCNVHPKQMDFIRMRGNKRFEAWCRSTRNKKFLPHHHSGDKEKYGYKALDKNGKFMGFYTRDYRPNMKGGHRHNHIRNAYKRMRKCHVCGEPIVKGCEYTDGFSEFQCRSCRTEECREQACLVGLSFGGVTFKTRR